ncbi:hypothetical protein HPB48_021483 [Haemaphysalis longicornis]|uniref:Uncharacterized protein n=1 Tax=Haemaphysalis longicornis TaxID=44386 RepID=A0A9J6FX63_HAELO|nr:hypothetical protein HPB48_021483 [Haemaphysalis longicornis]
MYSELGIDHNRWQGDGVSNCLSLFRPANRLKQALRYRDSRTDSSYADKVLPHGPSTSARPYANSIRLGVDGIITNYPERAFQPSSWRPPSSGRSNSQVLKTRPGRRLAVELLMSGGGGGNPIGNVFGDVSEVLQQFWAYLVTRLSGRVFRRRSSRDYDAADPPMSPRELAEQRYYRLASRTFRMTQAAKRTHEILTHMEIRALLGYIVAHGF